MWCSSNDPRLCSVFTIGCASRAATPARSRGRRRTPGGWWTRPCTADGAPCWAAPRWRCSWPGGAGSATPGAGLRCQSARSSPGLTPTGDGRRNGRPASRGRCSTCPARAGGRSTSPCTTGRGEEKESAAPWPGGPDTRFALTFLQTPGVSALALLPESHRPPGHVATLLQGFMLPRRWPSGQDGCITCTSYGQQATTIQGTRNEKKDGVGEQGSWCVERRTSRKLGVVTAQVKEQRSAIVWESRRTRRRIFLDGRFGPGQSIQRAVRE
jgi:hypothetical protein